jgi:hypothetical protein
MTRVSLVAAALQLVAADAAARGDGPDAVVAAARARAEKVEAVLVVLRARRGAVDAAPASLVSQAPVVGSLGSPASGASLGGRASGDSRGCRGSRIRMTVRETRGLKMPVPTR